MSSNTLQDLVIVGQKDVFFIPSVNFNANSGICSIEGESYLEDSAGFYQNLYDWLLNFMQSRKKITLNIKLTYFNTSSEKGIFDLLVILKKYQDEGGELEINWHHLHDDEDSVEEAEDFIQDTNLAINLVSY